MRPLSTVARGGTVAASGLLCHATIAEEQLAGAPSPPEDTKPPRYTSSQGSPRPPSPSLGRTRLISHLANNVLFPNRPNSPKPFFFNCRPSKFVLCSNFHQVIKRKVASLGFACILLFLLFDPNFLKKIQIFIKFWSQYNSWQESAQKLEICSHF